MPWEIVAKIIAHKIIYFLPECPQGGLRQTPGREPAGECRGNVCVP
uniref:Uncharacterized protein n=1 Tax=Anguilla anguilla TaxID=7936 RepID=A0A0E9STM5_ANGAN